MRENNNTLWKLRLQHFADGGDTGSQGAGVTGTAAGSQNGVNGDTAGLQGVKDSLATVRYGKQEGVMQSATVSTTDENGTVQETPDRQTLYNNFLKEYKDLDDARVSEIVRKRLAKPQEAANKYNELQPLLEMIGHKYGVDPNDAKALSKAIQEDDSYYEEEAMQRGMSVEEVKRIRTLERRNAELERSMREMESREQADRLYQKWLEQSDALKQVYPSFNLEAELQNPAFLDLLRSPNIDVRTAFEAVHHNEIVPAAMQFTAKTVETKIANKIKANGARPSENGMASQAPVTVKNDVSQLTDADIDEIARRVARGEHISF